MTILARVRARATASTRPTGLNNGRLPGGLPGPSTNVVGENTPETGLVVQFHSPSGQWRDDGGRNWSNGIRFFLPDLDVFEINASTLNETDNFSGVGTINFVHGGQPNQRKCLCVQHRCAKPYSIRRARQFWWFYRARQFASRAYHRLAGQRSVSGTLEQPYQLQSSARARGTQNHSLATPLDMVVSTNGSTLYVAAFGSSKIGVIPTSDLDNNSFNATANSGNYISVSGGGPSGLVLDEMNGALYVLTRFDNSISVVDLAAGTETNHVPLHNPEPVSLVNGRPILYDAFGTSSNGEASCSSCHILGNPDDDVSTNPLLINFGTLRMFVGGNADEINGTGNVDDFHPMKGPMSTQTLRGLATSGAMHWRGDRSTGFFRNQCHR